MKVIERFADLMQGPGLESLRTLIGDVEVIDADKLDGAAIGNRLIVLGNESDTGRLLSSFKYPQVDHYVQLGRVDFFRDLVTSSMLVKRPDHFLRNPIPFFVSNFTGNKGYEKDFREKSFTIKNTEEKNSLLDQLRDFLEQMPHTSRHWDSIVLIADELMMNAFFNAPVDQAGYSLYQHLPRGSKVKLLKGVIKFFIAHDSTRLIIGCEDPFGSMDRGLYLQKLFRAYESDMPMVEATATGAGLGSRLMIDRSIAFYVVVKKHTKTMVFCVLEIGKSAAQAQSIPKGLHLCFW